MPNRAHRKAIAEETVTILNQGFYTTSTGKRLNIDLAISNAVDGTRLYRPDDITVSSASDVASATSIEFELANETTFAGARHLLTRFPEGVCCLNFASAKNPGGGFLSGSQAQEESLARASALTACLQSAPQYYEVNRNTRTALYTDHIIYSPSVPVFRDDDEHLLEETWNCSIVTAPAPNAGAVRRNEPDNISSILPVLSNRAWRVLEISRLQGHRALVLGAWGCGVFANDPSSVAVSFRDHLLSDQFASAFDIVRFSILDPKNDGTFKAFQKVFADEI